MARRREEVAVPDPVTNLKGFPIHYDENTNENLMRRVSVRDMMAFAKKPDPPGRLLLHEELAQAKPNEDIIEVLLEVEPERIKKRKPGSGCLPIHIACLNINSLPSDLLVLLLDAWPESVQKQCNFGFLPLHKAIMANTIGQHPPNMHSLALVLDAYPNGVHVPNLRGQYPLHCAVEAKTVSCELVDLLIQAGGKKNVCAVVDRFGYTPLHKAVGRKKGPEERMIVEALLERYPEAAKVPDRQGMLPMHWAVSMLEPVLEVLIELMDAFPYAIFHKDDAGKLPLDRILAYGNKRCGSSMTFLNTKYEMFIRKKTDIIKMWEQDFLNKPPHINKLKAPKAAPRPTPYAFGTHDWTLNELHNTERQMALIIFSFRVQRKMTCTDEDMTIYLLLLRAEFVKRGGYVECFGPSLAETSGDGPIAGPKAKWWLAKIELPPWDHHGQLKPGSESPLTKKKGLK